MEVGSVRALGWIAIGANLYWASVAVAMHFLEPEFDPVRAPMSAYVLGHYGAWVTTTYFVMGAALIAIGCGLVKTLHPSGRTNAALSLTLIAAAAFFVAGLFPMDFPPPPRTPSGRLHLLGGLFAFPTMALSALLFSLSFRRDGYWRTVSVPALTLSAGMIAAYALGFLSILLLGFAGYAQRLFMILRFVWAFLVALHLIRSTGARGEPFGGAA
ncbi:MAG TPA: DUF998 domain-containing protein [Candidatus Binatia bacterium]|jgi:hypothetical protein|nr:DUF998 domain-containing protein [Candidatus Binatia bacterium]